MSYCSEHFIKADLHFRSHHLSPFLVTLKCLNDGFSMKLVTSAETRHDRVKALRYRRAYENTRKPRSKAILLVTSFIFLRTLTFQALIATYYEKKIAFRHLTSDSWLSSSKNLGVSGELGETAQVISYRDLIRPKLRCSGISLLLSRISDMANRTSGTTLFLPSPANLASCLGTRAICPSYSVNTCHGFLNRACMQLHVDWKSNAIQHNICVGNEKRASPQPEGRQSFCPA